MIYLDTSVALAHVLGEDRAPPDSLWDEVLVSSRLLEYEMWARIHSYGLGSPHGEAARALLARVALVKLETPVLSRALEPFPQPVRTLDALHLSTVHFLLEQGQAVELASYDHLMVRAARAMGMSLANCG